MGGAEEERERIYRRGREGGRAGSHGRKEKRTMCVCT